MPHNPTSIRLHCPQFPGKLCCSIITSDCLQQFLIPPSLFSIHSPQIHPASITFVDPLDFAIQAEQSSHRVTDKTDPVSLIVCDRIDPFETHDLSTSESLICSRTSKLCKSCWATNGGVQCLTFGGGGRILPVGDNGSRKGLGEL